MRLEEIYSVYEKGILKDINFTFEKGKFYYVVVQNSNIAQAILDVISLLGPIMEGKYIWQDKDISGSSYDEKTAIRLYNFGLIFKDALFDPDYNIYENLKLALYNNKKIDSKEKDNILNKLIKKYDGISFNIRRGNYDLTNSRPVLINYTLLTILLLATAGLIAAYLIINIIMKNPEKDYLYQALGFTKRKLFLIRIVKFLLVCLIGLAIYSFFYLIVSIF